MSRPPRGSLSSLLLDRGRLWMACSDDGFLDCVLLGRSVRSDPEFFGID
ncbi:MAG: hypothetical protein AAF236_11140 [Verrucomicrobiota bacterium]